jgi:hypothetical protein
MRLVSIAAVWIVLLLLFSGVPAGAQPPLPPVAQKMYKLFDELRTGAPLSFQLSDSEINEYLKYSLKATPRPGVESATVKFFSNNYVSTFTVVDFDAVERWKPGTIPMLLKPVLSGRKSVWVDYRFQANGGKATFTVEKAYLQEIRLPALVVEKVIQIVAARQPEHYDTSKPIPAPFGLRNVWTQGNVVHGQK